MEEWKEYRLGDCLEALIDYRGKTPKKTSFGIPLITAKIIKNGQIEPPTEYIAEKDYDLWMVRGLPKEGDVVLTTEAPLGEVAQLGNQKIALAQRVVTMRGKKGFLNNTYLKYFFLSNEGQGRLRARETGTTVTGIKQSELREVKITCPPYEIQKKIANILSSLDDKIEVNRMINSNLECSTSISPDISLGSSVSRRADNRIEDSESKRISANIGLIIMLNLSHTSCVGKGTIIFCMLCWLIFPWTAPVTIELTFVRSKRHQSISVEYPFFPCITCA